MEARPSTTRRVVTRWQIVGLSLNDVIGSGVYLLPAAAAAMLGSASVWAVFLAGLAVLLIVLCFAEASSHFDEPGSAYLYARTAFGGMIGFQVGWMTWIARIAAVASLSAGFALALSYLWPGANTGLTGALVVAAPIVVLTGVNIVGVRSGVVAANLLVVAKLAPLTVFLAAGAVSLPYSDVTQPAGDAGRLGEAALLLLFAYAGFENTPAAAGEYRNPRRDVPFALLVNITLVTLLYALVQWLALSVVPELRNSAAPLAQASEARFGGWAGWLLTAGAAVGILGTTGNSVLLGPRYLYALARDGFGPSSLGRVHPRFRTPAAAIFVQSAIALPLALSGSFIALASLSVVARLATYIGTAASVPILRRKIAATPATLRLPGGPAIPVAAVAVSLALASSASAANLVAAGLAVAVGFALYARRRNSANATDLR
jgi:amino acid transporter